MPFNLSAPRSIVPASPDLLFLELPRRAFQDVLPAQRDVLREYAKTGTTAPDLAIQSPTGSGKTLTGLLIAEWNLRKNKERVVYLCPNNQLVHQVVDDANTKYGLSVVGFEGQKKDYLPASKTAYEQADKVAVTNYSSLFNSKPYFDDASLIILDDAHATENYISKMWSLSVSTKQEKQQTLHKALVGLISPKMRRSDVAHLTGTAQDSSGWIEKLPTPRLEEIKTQFIEILDANCEDAGLIHAWKLLRDHVDACHLYLSADEILLRPLIPPTWTHEPFVQARQRIYMSATLGRGGDLERLTGRPKIQRQPAPPGMDVQGVGRRYFVFPSMSLDTDECDNLALKMIKAVDRALYLVPSDYRAGKVSEAIREEIKYKIFDAGKIESNKEAFVKAKKAVAVLANRYDGIDFPEDDCRLLIIEGFPKATNLQERFLMARMAANALFQERSLTRTVQAVGRCTRSLRDLVLPSSFWVTNCPTTSATRRCGNAIIRLSNRSWISVSANQKTRMRLHFSTSSASFWKTEAIGKRRTLSSKATRAPSSCSSRSISPIWKNPFHMRSSTRSDCGRAIPQPPWRKLKPYWPASLNPN